MRKSTRCEPVKPETEDDMICTEHQPLPTSCEVEYATRPHHTKHQPCYGRQGQPAWVTPKEGDAGYLTGHINMLSKPRVPWTRISPPILEGKDLPEANWRDTQYPTAAVPINKASSHHPARKTRRRALEKQPRRLERMRTPGLRRVDRNTPETLQKKIKWKNVFE